MYIAKINKHIFTTTPTFSRKRSSQTPSVHKTQMYGVKLWEIKKKENLDCKMVGEEGSSENRRGERLERQTISRRNTKLLGQFTLSLGQSTTSSTNATNKCPSLVRNAMVSENT